jgi:hypothetical protein
MTNLQVALERKLAVEKATHVQPALSLKRLFMSVTQRSSISKLTRWLGECERDERKEKECLSNDREEEKSEWQKLSTPSPPSPLL